MNNIFYIYVHKRKTDLSVFYVGKGKDNRHKSLSGRNLHWKNIVNKHGFISEILFKDLTEEESFKIEIDLIKKYKKNGIILCNRSTGGEGAAGVIHSEQTKEKWRIAKLGKKQSKEHAEKSRKARLGFKNTLQNIEKTASARRRPVIGSSGMIFKSTEDAKNFKKENGYPKATQSNISACALGNRNNAYGETWSYDISKKPIFISKKYNKKKILLKDLNIIFNSVQSATIWVRKKNGSASHQCISEAARKNKTAYFYKWEYVK
jgi:hypothetical protein